MMRHLFRLTLAAGLLFMVDVTSSAADTITLHQIDTSSRRRIHDGSIRRRRTIDSRVRRRHPCGTAA